MNRLTNYSGIDRDSRKFINGYQPTKDDAVRAIKTEFERLFTVESDSREIEANPVNSQPLSEAATTVLAYFDSAKNQSPKTIRDLKKADRLTNLTDVMLYAALDQLVKSGELDFDGKESWTKSDW
jgi:hypothetical protein